MRAADVIAKNKIAVLSHLEARIWVSNAGFVGPDYAGEDDIEPGTIVRVNRDYIAILLPDGGLMTRGTITVPSWGMPAIYTPPLDHPPHPELPRA